MKVGKMVVGRNLRSRTASEVAHEGTEQKQVEERIRESERRFRNIFENASDAMIYLDRVGRILDVNTKAVELYGGSKRELLGKHFTKVGVFSLRDIPRLMSAFAKTIVGKRTDINIRIKNKKGREIHLECSSSLMKTDGGHVESFLTIARDITGRKRAEEGLRRSEEKYRTLFEEAIDAIFVADADTGLLIDGNRAACELVGREKSELVGEHQRILHPPETIEGEFSATFKQHLGKKEGEVLETQVITKEGEVKEVAIKGNTFELGGKRLIQGIFRDITERKRMKGELKKSENLWRSLFELAPDGILTINMKGVITLANEAFLSLTGFSEDEIVGKHFSKLGTIRARDIPKYLKLFSSVLRGKILPPLEFVYRHKDGTTKWGEGHFSLIEVGGKKEILAICREITRHKELEEELRGSERKYHELFEAVADGLFQTNLEGNYVMVNPAFAAMFGYKPEEMLHGRVKTWRTYASKEDRKAYLEELHKKGELRNRVLRFERRDDSTGWGEVSISVRRDEYGEIIGYEGTARDITERRRYGESLEALHRHVIELGGAKSMEQIAEMTFNVIERVLGFGYGGFGVVEGDTHRVIYMRGIETPFPPPLPLNGKGIVVRTVKTGETQLVPDIRLDEDYVGFPTVEGFLSELAVPVKVDGEAVAVINVESNRLDAFTEEDQRLLEIISEHVASAIRRVREQTEQQRYRDRLEELHRHVTELSRAGSIKQIAEITFNAIERVLGFYQGGFGVVEGSLLSFIHICGVLTEKSFELPLDGPGVTVRTVKTGETQRIHDVRKDKDFVYGLAENSSITLSELAVPIALDGRVEAVINLESTQLNDFTDEDQKLVEIFAEHVAAAITRLRQMESLSKEEERLSALHESALTLAKVRSLEAVVQSAIESMRRSLGFEVASYLAVEDGHLDTVALEGAETRGIRLPLEGPGITVKAARAGETQLVYDTRLEPAYVEGSIPALSELAVPVKVEGEVAAVLNVENTSINAYDDNDKRILETLAQHVASALSRLRKMETLEGLVEERTRELKEMQELLLKAERMATIGETAAMVGHDLRNPLQVIMNTIYIGKEMMKSAPAVGWEFAETHGVDQLLNTFEEQVEYMNKIVSDLQDYAGPVSPELADTSLNQLINDILSAISVPKTVEVHISLEEEFPALRVDPTLMKRVFTNLVINALQAMPEGGRLTIRASRTEEAASISIQDTGSGIPEKNLQKLFQPLFTTKAKGQGFGLPVCQRLVEAHGGGITVESDVGIGSTFTVHIPLNRR